MVGCLRCAPTGIDGSPEGEQTRAAMKTPLHCARIVSFLLPAYCFAEAVTPSGKQAEGGRGQRPRLQVGSEIFQRRGLATRLRRTASF